MLISVELKAGFCPPPPRYSGQPTCAYAESLAVAPIHVSCSIQGPVAIVTGAGSSLSRVAILLHISAHRSCLGSGFTFGRTRVKKDRSPSVELRPRLQLRADTFIQQRTACGVRHIAVVKTTREVRPLYLYATKRRQSRNKLPSMQSRPCPRGNDSQRKLEYNSQWVDLLFQQTRAVVAEF